MMLKELSTLRKLLRQGLAIRGHSDKEGNLHQFMSMRCEDCPELRRWLTGQNYMSHDIINELILIMGQSVLRNIISNIHTATWYTVMADETRDISNAEQMTIVIRWVDDSYDIHEDFIGMVKVDDITSKTLAEALKDVLMRCNLPISLCRGQAYDGAANMMGKLKGVATQLLAENPSALPIHCFAHNLNLCLQSSSRQNQAIRDALDVATEISQLINYSPKRCVLFNKIKEEICPDSPGLRPLCPTRWTVRTGAFNAIITNYAALCETFNQVNATSHDDYGRRAGGLVANMDRFSTFFGIKLSHLIFSGLEQISMVFQNKDVNIQEAQHASQLAIHYLGQLRNDAKFDEFYELTVKQSETLTEKPCLPRYKRLPKRLDDGGDPHRYSEVKDFFRVQFYEIVDQLSGEISSRFDEQKLQIPKDIENLLIHAANGQDITIPESIKELYGPGDIDMEKLYHQLRMLPGLVDLAKKDHPSTFQYLKKVTKITTLTQLFNAITIARDLYSEIHKLIRIFLTLPVSTATAERSFSSLRRLKTFLRATMSQERLNSCLILHVHKVEADLLDLHSIAKEFVDVNQERKKFFGVF